MNKHFQLYIFHKVKLQNRFDEHLPMVVNMYFQTLFTLENFLYDVTFENCQKMKSRKTKFNGGTK